MAQIEMEIEEEEVDEDKVYFSLPKGDADLDDLDKGEKITVRAVVMKEPDGSFCLVSVNGQSVGGEAEEEVDLEVEPSMESALGEIM